MKSPFSNDKPRDWVSFTERGSVLQRNLCQRLLGCWCSCKCLWGVWEADEGGVPLRPPLANAADTAFMSSPTKAGPRADRLPNP